MKNNLLSSNPISEPVFFILLSLSTGRKHGYAILKNVETMSDGKLLLSTSTLYSALGRLEGQKMVRRVPVEGQVTPGLPRKVYELTSQGLKLLQAESGRVQRLAALSLRYQVDHSREG